MTTKNRKVNRDATDRLARLVATELKRQGVTEAEVARQARLPRDVFRSLRRGYRPTVDRADQLLRALHRRMVLGDDADDQ